jgi:hypothetical protein
MTIRFSFTMRLTNGSLGREGAKGSGGGPIGRFSMPMLTREKWIRTRPTSTRTVGFQCRLIIAELAKNREPYQYKPVPADALEANGSKIQFLCRDGKGSGFKKPAPMYKAALLRGTVYPILTTLTGLKINRKCEVVT